MKQANKFRSHRLFSVLIALVVVAGGTLATPTPANASGCTVVSSKDGGMNTEFGLKFAGGAWISKSQDASYTCLGPYATGYKSDMFSFWGGAPGRAFGTRIQGGIGNPAHNCTLFAAYMLSRNGFTPPPSLQNMLWGNAKDWGAANSPLANAGFRVRTAAEQAPAEGSIAVSNSGAFGHVSYVYKVVGDQVYTYSDNYSSPGWGYSSTEVYPASHYSGFLHIKDVPQGPKPVPSGTSNGGSSIKNPATALCLDVPGGLAWGEGFKDPARPTQIYGCNSTAAQQWIYDRTSKTIRVFAEPNVRCLDIAGGNQANGSAVQVWQCNGTDAQKWVISGDGSIRSTQNYCLDIKDRGTKPGTTLQIWKCTSSPGSNQLWSTTIANPPAFAGFGAIVVSGGGNVRNQPTSAGALIRTAPGNSSVTIMCQISGQAVTYNGTPYPIWDKLADGNYMWDGVIKNTAVMTWDSRIPRC